MQLMLRSVVWRTASQSNVGPMDAMAHAAHAYLGWSVCRMGHVDVFPIVRGPSVEATVAVAIVASATMGTSIRATCVWVSCVYMKG